MANDNYQANTRTLAQLFPGSHNKYLKIFLRNFISQFQGKCVNSCVCARFSVGQMGASYVTLPAILSRLLQLLRFHYFI